MFQHEIYLVILDLQKISKLCYFIHVLSLISIRRCSKSNYAEVPHLKYTGSRPPWDLQFRLHRELRLVFNKKEQKFCVKLREKILKNRFNSING